MQKIANTTVPCHFLVRKENWITTEQRVEIPFIFLAGSFFKEQLWNTLRFLIGLFLIVSVLEAQLQMRSMRNLYFLYFFYVLT